MLETTLYISFIRETTKAVEALVVAPIGLFQPEYGELSRLTRDGTAATVSRDQILRREGGHGNIPFPCSADHEQDWQPSPVDPNSCFMG